MPEAAAERGLEAIYRDEVVLTKRNGRGAPLSSSSQPQIMAIMLELLGCEPGQRVLEIGAGTGYNAALLAELVGERGRVVSLDIDRDTATSARAHLASAGGAAGVVRVVCADGEAGAARYAPFDRVIATASVARLPGAWRDQLSPEGILVAPVWLQERMDRQVVAAFRRQGRALRSEAVVPGGFMALRHGPEAVMQVPRANVQAGWMVGDDASMATLEGDVVRRMTPAARRRLASLLTEQPRRLPLRPSTRLSLAHFVALAPASLVHGSRDRRFFLGVATTDGRSVAGIGYDAKGKAVAMATGSDRAEAALIRLLQRAERGWARGFDAVLVAEGENELAITCSWARSASEARGGWAKHSKRVASPALAPGPLWAGI